MGEKPTLAGAFRIGGIPTTVTLMKNGSTANQDAALRPEQALGNRTESVL